MLQGRATVLEDEAAERADPHLEDQAAGLRVSEQGHIGQVARLQMGAKYSAAGASGDEPPRNASTASVAAPVAGSYSSRAAW